MGSLRPILHSRSLSCICQPTILLSVDLRLFCSSLSCFLLQDVGKQGWESGPAFLGHSLDCRASCLGAC